MNRIRPALFALSVVVLPLIAGCGGGASAVSAIASELDLRSQVLGRWEPTSINYNGNSAPCPSKVSIPDNGDVSCTSGDYLELRADGTATVKDETGTDNLRWQLDGVKIVTPDDTDPDAETSVAITGLNKMTLTTTYKGGDRYVRDYSRR